MWPQHDDDAVNPLGPEPAIPVAWPPFDIRAAMLHEAFLDPGIDQVEALERAWIRYAADIINSRENEGRGAA